MKKLLSVCLCQFSLFIGAYAQSKGLPPNVLPLNDLSSFKQVADNWSIAGDVNSDLNKDKNMVPVPGKGILVNIPTEKSRDNIFTNWEHGDIEIEFDFMMPKNSNSGIYFQARYEIQMLDSWGIENPGSGDCGGVYARWDDKRPNGQQSYDGRPPRYNVSKAPGLWQHYNIVFLAPKFNDKGVKIANAKFLKVVQNGVTIHENVELTGPTRASAFNDEVARGPIMIQGDHGPVAIRNIKYKKYDNEPVKLTNIKYDYFEGEFDILPTTKPIATGVADAINFKMVGNKKGKNTNEGTFAMNYYGDMEVKTGGLYKFELNWGSGWAGLYIDGKELIKVNPDGVINLEAGKHKFSITYIKRWWGGRYLTLHSEGPNSRLAAIHDASTTVIPINLTAPILVTSDKKEPAIIRSFVYNKVGKKTSCISVGDMNKLNYSLDVEQGNLLRVWKGEFLDLTPLWHERGSGEIAVPLGSVVELAGGPAVASLSDKNAAWPDSAGTQGVQYEEYSFDKGYPVFKYSIGNEKIEDQFISEQGGKMLTRQLKINGSADTKNLWVRIASGTSIKEVTKGFYAVDDKNYFLSVKDFATNPPVLRTINNRQELLLPVAIKGNQAIINYSLIW